jgi:hypothetical protein
VTYVDPNPSYACALENYVEIPLGADIWDGNPDGSTWLCVQFQQFNFVAGTRGFMTNPSSARSLSGSDMSFWSSYSAVPYFISSPASGNWIADADHYYGYNSQYCPVHYNPPPYFSPWDPIIDIDWCTAGPSETSIYYTSSSDNAQVP